MASDGLTPVAIDAAFRRRLKKKPREMQESIAEAITRLRTDWRQNGLRTHRVQGTRNIWEARLDRGNRLTFHWDGDTIVLRNHCSHDILKRP